MSEQIRQARSAGDSDFVEFRTAGEPAKGEFRCAECGYGITIYRTLPACPMCASTTWESSAWSPFARAAGASLHADALL